jgi:endonuclease/exonuclease/phosphatase family metal-dependent hydrolase
VRLLSYHVDALHGGMDALAGVIRAADPDVVAVQGAPRWIRWRSRCAALARKSGLLVVTGGRPAGTALLLAKLRVRVLATRDVGLPGAAGGLAVASIELAGVRYTTASVLLRGGAGSRRRQAEQILSTLSPAPEALVLAVHGPEGAGGAAFATLSTRLVDAWTAAGSGAGATFPSARPRQRLDAVFVDPRLEVVRCALPRTPGLERASAYLPVAVELRPLPDGGAGQSAG